MTKDERYFISGGLLEFATAMVALLMVCIAAGPGKECFAVEGSAVVRKFKTGLPGDFLMLPVTIGHKTYPFALDTGSSFSIFDASLRSFLGAPTRPIGVSTPKGTQELQRYAAPPMRIGGSHFWPREALCLDFREEFLAFGEDLFGMIGQDFLRDKIFTVDFDRGEIQLLNDLHKPRGARLPLNWKLGAPFVVVDIPGVGKEEFLVDTGGAGLS